jgi:rRNA-processing protein FCF1
VSPSRARSGSPRPAVVLDTNALFLAVRSGFPLEAEVDRLCPGAVLLVPSSVLGELDALARRLVPGAAAARAAADRYRAWPTDARGDDGVLDVARSADAWVVTADRELKRRLRVRGMTALVPRDRHRLEVVRGRPPPAPTRPTGGAPPRGNS